jgi:hypothetical protein
MTTLADINNTLTTQNTIQLETRDRVAELGGSFSDFFSMIKDASGDDLEAKREQKETNKRVKDSVDRSSSGSKGGFFDFDVSSLLPLAGAFLGGLIKRGIPALLATVLADEIGEAVKKLTGSQILGSITEWATLGGAAGFLVGGLKGGIIGALLGAVFSDGSRDAIANKLNELLGLELKKDDWQTLAISGGIAAAGLSLPKLIGLLAGKLMPFFLGPKGLLIGLSIAIGGLIVAYATNEEFRKDVNKALAPMFLAITDALTSVKDWIKNKINEFLPSFVTTSAEDRAIREQMSKTKAGQKLLEEEANIRGQISDIGGSRAELGGIDKKDVNAMKSLAKRLGIDEVYGKKVDSYTANNAFMLQQNLQNELLKRQGMLQGTLKREGGFQEMYDTIEKQLTTNDAAKAQAQKDAELKAKYNGLTNTIRDTRGPDVKRDTGSVITVPDLSGFVMPTQNSTLASIAELKERKLSEARERNGLNRKTPTNIINAIRDMRGPDAGYINAIDASTTNNISNPTQTTYVGETRPSTSNGRASSYGFDWGTAP